MTRVSRVAVTRDEPEHGTLSSALSARGLVPVLVPTVREAEPIDRKSLDAAAARLEDYDWLVVASRRAVTALQAARGDRPLPPSLRTAAVGASTAAALIEHGARAPLVGEGSGAAALIEALIPAERWSGKKVLLPRAEEGGRELALFLRRVGARVDEVVAYRTVPVPPADISEAWRRGSPDAVVVASPSAACALVAGIGLEPLRKTFVVAIGPTTAAALAGLGVESRTPERADFVAVAALIAEWAGGAGPRPDGVQDSQASRTTGQQGGAS